jgi:hypothetical protein
MDLRIETIFNQEMKNDTSFQEKDSGLSLIFGGERYTKLDMRNTWDMGIKHGIEIGLRRASLEGQRIELNHNTKDGKNKEFLDKLYKLTEEYNCAIQYHPQLGMVVLDTDTNLI